MVLVCNENMHLTVNWRYFKETKATDMILGNCKLQNEFPFFNSINILGAGLRSHFTQWITLICFRYKRVNQVWQMDQNHARIQKRTGS